jgi:hypothetical protein
MKNLPASKKPAEKQRHSLSSIDKEKRTAICAVCGPTDVHRITIKKKYTTYICATKGRQQSRNYRLAHPHIPHPQQFSPNAHVLSNVDDETRTAVCSQCGPVRIHIRRYKNLITRCCSKAGNRRAMLAEKKRRAENLDFIAAYKLSHGCKNCGYRESSTELQLHARDRDRRADHISKLMRLKRERLVQELEKFDVLCKKCHDGVHQKTTPSRKRRQRNPLPFMFDANL